MKPRPLWRCRKCGKYFVTRNMWHGCARHTLAEHFAGKPAFLRALFDGVVGMLKRSGPVRVVPGKTGIAFQVRMRFARVLVRGDRLEASFVLPRRIEHPRIRKVIAYSPRAYGHHVEICSPGDLDDELAGWLRESYRVGAQAGLLAGKKAAPTKEGNFSWSELSIAKTFRTRNDAMTRPRSSRANSPKEVRPLWKCPTCGREFPTRNQFHICSSLTLKEALQGKSPLAVALFRKLLALARRCGPVKIVPQKTRIALQARKIFLGVRFLREAIDCEFPFPRRLEHSRFRQILSVSQGSHYHYVRVTSEKELDRDVRAWLREAHRAAQ